jgi:hypothetical protein
VTYELSTTPVEDEVIAEIRRAGGFTSDAHAIKCAIERFATFLAIPVPPEAFAVPYGPAMRGLLEQERRHRDGDPDGDPQADLFADAPANRREAS